MTRVDDMIEFFESSKGWASCTYNDRHAMAHAWDAVTTSSNRLSDVSAIEVLLDDARSFLGGGADSSVMKATVDLSRLTSDQVREILIDMKTHEWYARRFEEGEPEGNFDNYRKVRSDCDEEVECMSDRLVVGEVESRIKKLGFRKVKGRKYRGVAAVSVTKIGDKEAKKPRRIMRPEFLYGMQHPNLISTVFAVLSNNHLVQLMEFGGNRRWESLELEQLVKVTADVANGVAHLHDCYGVLHRDIKPSNVLISGRKSPRAKLADYSIVKMFDLQKKGLQTRTETGRGLGTPGYRSIEQCIGNASKKSDVFGLGALLYAYVTRKPPADQAQGHVLMQDPIEATGDSSSMMKNLRVVMAACLQPYESERYDSAMHVKEDLEGVLHGGPPVHALAKVQAVTRSIPRYSARVFSEKDHEQEEVITAEFVRPAMPPKKNRYCAKGCAYVVLAALVGGTVVLATNPDGLGDRLQIEVKAAYSKAKAYIESLVGR